MSETRFPSSRPPSSAAGGGGDRPLLQNALVTDAPSAVTQAAAAKTLLLDGRITGHHPQRGETVISTAKGDITVQTGASALPLGGEVSVELKMQGLSLRANISAIRAKNAEAKAAQDIARPAPPAPDDNPRPVRAGDRFMALRLPAEAPPPAAMESGGRAPESPPGTSRPTLEQAARIIEAVRASVGVARMAMMLPPVPDVPLPVIWQVLNTRDVMTALVRLPDNMQQQLLDFIARPDVAGALRQIMPAAQISALLPAAPDAADADMAQAQIALRPSIPPNPAGTAPAPLPAIGGMAGLMPLLEGFMPKGAASMMVLGGKLPNMAPGAQNLPLPQNMVQITIEEMPAAQNHPAPAARPAGSVIATVESLTSSGAPVLKTAEAHFVMRQSVPLPVGTQLLVTVTPATPQDILAESLMAAPRPASGFDPLFMRSWPSLQEALQILTVSAAPIAQALAQSIPSAGVRMAPTTLFFLAALRMGNIESWLGAPTLEALRSGGRRDIADRLTQDFARLAALSKSGVAGEWRAISMPLMQQDQHIHLIQLFLRQQAHDGDENESGDAAGRAKTTRFILNLHLSRMGEMQLDGFVQQKRFDLILRSEEKLPADIRQEILQKFAAGLAQTGMEGGLRFQARAEQWVNIPLAADAGVQA